MVFTSLAALSNNSNPSTTVTGPTTTTVAAGDKIVCELYINHSNPTAVACSITDNGGTPIPMIEIPNARVSRSVTGFTLVSFYLDAPGGGLTTGRTVTATWVNGGDGKPDQASNGGGSLANVAKITPTGTFAPGPPDVASGATFNSANAATTTTAVVTLPLNGATAIPIASNAGFSSSGVALVGGTEVIYTGTTATSLTGCRSGGTGTIGSGAAVTQAPYTRKTPTPSNQSAAYVAVAALAVNHNVAALETFDNAYTAVAQASNTTRSILLDLGAKAFTAPVASQFETWSQTWGAAKNWCAVIYLFAEVIAAAPANTVAPAVTGTPAVGSVLSCSTGTWSNTPTSHTYQWWRDCGTSGAILQAIVGATASSYTVTNDDIGSALVCQVKGVNASGPGAPKQAAALTSVVPAPAGVLSARVVASYVAQSDRMNHLNMFSKPVLAGDMLVLFIGLSNAGLTDGNGNKSDVGSVADRGGDSFAQQAEVFGAPATPDSNATNSAQAFTALSAGGAAYGDWVNMTVFGMANGGAQGTATAYHGQSPGWFVVAISPGGLGALQVLAHGDNVSFNTTTHTSDSIAPAGSKVWVGAARVGSPGANPPWFTQTTAGMSKLFDAWAANDSINTLAPSAVNGTWISTASNGGESGYSVAAEQGYFTSGFSGSVAGTTVGFTTLSNVVVAVGPFSGHPGPPTQAEPSGQAYQELITLGYSTEMAGKVRDRMLKNG